MSNITDEHYVVGKLPIDKYTEIPLSEIKKSNMSDVQKALFIISAIKALDTKVREEWDRISNGQCSLAWLSSLDAIPNTLEYIRIKIKMGQFKLEFKPNTIEEDLVGAATGCLVDEFFDAVGANRFAKLAKMFEFDKDNNPTAVIFGRILNPNFDIGYINDGAMDMDDIIDKSTEGITNMVTYLDKLVKAARTVNLATPRAAKALSILQASIINCKKILDQFKLIDSLDKAVGKDILHAIQLFAEIDKL